MTKPPETADCLALLELEAEADWLLIVWGLAKVFIRTAYRTISLITTNIQENFIASLTHLFHCETIVLSRFSAISTVFQLRTSSNHLQPEKMNYIKNPSRLDAGSEHLNIALFLLRLSIMRGKHTPDEITQRR